MPRVEVAKIGDAIKEGVSSCESRSWLYYIYFVPPFQETEVDKYFLHFEKMSLE